jgi:hypothetical protein
MDMSPDEHVDWLREQFDTADWTRMQELDDWGDFNEGYILSLLESIGVLIKLYDDTDQHLALVQQGIYDHLKMFGARMAGDEYEHLSPLTRPL